LAVAPFPEGTTDPEGTDVVVTVEVLVEFARFAALAK